MKRVRIIVKGEVHGVGFRAFAWKTARNLGLTGFVRNIPGSVELIAEGDEQKLKELIQLCKKGPSLSKVTSISFDFSESKNEFNKFEISP